MMNPHDTALEAATEALTTWFDPHDHDNAAVFLEGVVLEQAIHEATPELKRRIAEIVVDAYNTAIFTP